MKLVIQRVNRAKVTRVEDMEIVGKIDNGFFVLLGIKKADTKEIAKQLAEKILKIRLMPDENRKMNLSVGEVGGQILVVSQFTLYANTKDGNRPSFVDAENPEKAREIYEYFVSELKKGGLKVETGSFGDYMKIDLELDGPVTITLES